MSAIELGLATEVEDRYEPESVVHLLRRGLSASPELRVGLGPTLMLALFAGIGRIVIPILAQQVLDRGYRDDELRMDVIVPLVLAATVMVALTTAARRAMQLRLARTSEQALSALRVRAFAHIHSLSLAHHTEGQRGTLVSRVTADVDTLSQFLDWGGLAWITNIALASVVVTVMAIYDWRLTVVAVAAIVPLYLTLRFLQGRLIAAYDAQRTRVGELLAALSEMIQGAAVVRSYGIRDRSTETVQGAIDRYRDARIRSSSYSALLFPSGEVFSAMAIAGVIAAGVALGPDGGLSRGTLVAFIFLVTILLEPVAEFTEILDNTQTAAAGWRKVLDVLDTPVEVIEPEPGVELPHHAADITFDHVTFAYHRGPVVLDDVSLHIDASTRVAVVGATGSGKTTFAKLLTRLADPVAGRVLVNGIDLREVSPASRRAALSMVPQDGFLFDTTVGENVRFGHTGASDDEVRLAFVDLGLEDWLHDLSHGLETAVGERGEQLSAGERQLVALARAYVANPVCLILDEATSAVDPATEARLARALDGLTRGRTSITIAHRLSTAERADVVLVFDAGRIVEQGTHDELATAGGVYASLYASWLGNTAV